MQVGNNTYDIPNKGLNTREMANFYMNAIKNEVSLAIGLQIGTLEYDMALKQCCTNIIDKQNKEFLAQSMIDRMINGELDVNGQTLNQSNDFGSNTRSMGFSNMWILGLITLIAAVTVIILGILMK